MGTLALMVSIYLALTSKVSAKTRGTRGVIWSKGPLLKADRVSTLASEEIKQAELLVIFEENTRGPGLLNNPIFKREFETATSSATITNGDAADLDNVPGKHLRASSIEDATAILSNQHDVATNGLCDVLYVELGRIHSREQFGDFVSLVNDITAGRNAFAILSDITPDYIAAMTAPARRLDSSSTTIHLKYVRMTPDLLAGILTGILMAFVIMLGLTCLSSIQTPSQFTDKPPPSSREY